ncbi:MAG: hypothetical protein ACK40T_05655 [Akkermansiaceae bacterium]|jgi:hypothetical protein
MNKNSKFGSLLFDVLIKRQIMKATLLGLIFFVGLLTSGKSDEPEKPHLCPCGKVYKEMMSTGFSFEDQSQFYTIVLKNNNEWGLYYCWDCGTELPERDKRGGEEFPVVHDGPPVHLRPEKPKPCGCNISKEALYNGYHTLSFDGKRYVMQVLGDVALEIRFCWFCGGTMPEFKDEEWSVIDVAPATKSITGTLKEVAAELNGQLEACRKGTRLKPTTIIVNEDVAHIRVEDTCAHSVIGHAIWCAARHAGVGLKVEENKIILHADAAAKERAEKTEEEQKAIKENDPFLKSK